MNEVIMKRVLEAIKRNSGSSSTAIAKIAGYSKASSIRTELDQLIDDGKIQEDTSGRFPVYKISKGKSISKSKQSVQKNQDQKVSTISLPHNGQSGELPSPNQSMMDGYKLENIIFKGEKMKKIVCPDNKAIRIKDEEKLLVINGEPKFVVESADQVLTCIKKYSQDKGLTVFTVDDICQNKKIGTEKDLEVKDKHVLFLTIKKHNKAAEKLIHMIVC